MAAPNPHRHFSSVASTIPRGALPPELQEVSASFRYSRVVTAGAAHPSGGGGSGGPPSGGGRWWPSPWRWLKSVLLALLVVVAPVAVVVVAPGPPPWSQLSTSACQSQQTLEC